MMQPLPTEIEFLQTDPAHYALAVKEMAARWLKPSTEMPVHPAMQQALWKYSLAALQKGADPDTIKIPDIVLQFGAAAILMAAAILPNKVSRSNLRRFSRAARFRPPMPELRRLFPAGQDRIMVALADDARPVDVRIDEFIAAHNRAAKAHYEAAVVRNDRNAGQPIEQRQIRRDAADPARLSTQSPKTQDWNQSRKLAAFLYETGHWALADDFQLYNGQNTKVQKAAPGLELPDIANRQSININACNPNDLAIVITERLMPLGEMSTGQRWSSCMAEDGINFRYVAQDVRAGTLIAYVVSRKDPDARYPLARILLKPYHTDKGETVWVPGKIYGANAGVVSDGVASMVQKIATVLNRGKSGTFTMDKRLYADGQPVTVTLSETLTEDGLALSIREYRESMLADLNQELVVVNAKIDPVAPLAATDLGRAFADDFETIRFHNTNVVGLLQSLSIDMADGDCNYYKLRKKMTAFASTEREHETAIPEFMEQVRTRITRVFGPVSEYKQKTMDDIESGIRSLSRLTASQSCAGLWRKAMLRASTTYIGFATLPEPLHEDAVQITARFSGMAIQQAWHSCSWSMLAEGVKRGFDRAHLVRDPDSGEAGALPILAAMKLHQSRKTKARLERKIRTLDDPTELARSYFRLIRRTAISCDLPEPLEILATAKTLVGEGAVTPGGAGIRASSRGGAFHP
jgi:hypothetical protein